MGNIHFELLRVGVLPANAPCLKGHSTNQQWRGDGGGNFNRTKPHTASATGAQGRAHCTRQRLYSPGPALLLLGLPQRFPQLVRPVAQASGQAGH